MLPLLYCIICAIEKDTGLANLVLPSLQFVSIILRELVCVIRAEGIAVFSYSCITDLQGMQRCYPQLPFCAIKWYIATEIWDNSSDVVVNNFLPILSQLGYPYANLVALSTSLKIHGFKSAFWNLTPCVKKHLLTWQYSGSEWRETGVTHLYIKICRKIYS